MLTTHIEYPFSRWFLKFSTEENANEDENKDEDASSGSNDKFDTFEFEMLDGNSAVVENA